MTLATPEYLREIARLTSGNREMYRNACKDAADEIERLCGILSRLLPRLIADDESPEGEDWAREINEIQIAVKSKG